MEHEFWVFAHRFQSVLPFLALWLLLFKIHTLADSIHIEQAMLELAPSLVHFLACLLFLQPKESVKLLELGNLTVCLGCLPDQAFI